MSRADEVKRAQDTLRRIKASKEYQQRVADAEREENERTVAIGLFNFADTFRKAAAALHGTQYRATHRDGPVRFLYYHALELYLKVFLRLHGLTVQDLASRMFGHRYCCLLESARTLGLALSEKDVAVFSMLINSDAVIRSRYLSTGYFSLPDMPELDGVCESLRSKIVLSFRAQEYTSL